MRWGDKRSGVNDARRFERFHAARRFVLIELSRGALSMVSWRVPFRIPSTVDAIVQRDRGHDPSVLVSVNNACVTLLENSQKPGSPKNIARSLFSIFGRKTCEMLISPFALSPRDNLSQPNSAAPIFLRRKLYTYPLVAVYHVVLDFIFLTVYVERYIFYDFLILLVRHYKLHPIY